MKKYLVSILFFIGLFIFPAIANAQVASSGLTQTQINAVVSLLQSFGAYQPAICAVERDLGSNLQCQNVNVTVASTTEPVNSIAPRNAVVPFTNFNVSVQGGTAIMSSVSVQLNLSRGPIAQNIAGAFKSIVLMVGSGPNQGEIIGSSVLSTTTGQVQIVPFSQAVMYATTTTTFTVAGVMSGDLSNYAGSVLGINVVGAGFVDISGNPLTIVNNFPISGAIQTINSSLIIGALNYSFPSSSSQTMVLTNPLTSTSSENISVSKLFIPSVETAGWQVTAMLTGPTGSGTTTCVGQSGQFGINNGTYNICTFATPIVIGRGTSITLVTNDPQGFVNSLNSILAVGATYGFQILPTYSVVPVQSTSVLTVAPVGQGSGIISGVSTTSTQANILCTWNGASQTTTGTCSGSYLLGSTVTLSISTTTGSGFAGWGGVCYGSASTCTVLIGATNQTVTANFNKIKVMIPMSTVLGSTYTASNVVTAPVAIPAVTIVSPSSNTPLVTGTPYTFISTSINPLSNVIINITNSSGQVVKSVTVSVVAANSNFSWTIPSTWLPGTYTVSATANGNSVYIVNNSFTVVAPGAPKSISSVSSTQTSAVIAAVQELVAQLESLQSTQ